VIAHETAHQWFGDAVTEQSWAHLWLSEGFATYFAALWVEHARGDSAFRSEMRAMRAKILADSAVTWRRPVLDSAETNYLRLLNVNSYEKGAWTLHMLRSLLGDSAFFDGVRGYYMHHRHSTAVTDDLRRELERASGADLRWFFDQWLRRPGVIDVTASVRVDRERRELVVDLAQGARTAPYRFPLTLDVTDAAGRRQRVALDVPASAHSVLRVPTTLRGRALRVVLDPDVRLLATFSQR
jgi:aminopeptidase N